MFLKNLTKKCQKSQFLPQKSFFGHFLVKIVKNKALSRIIDNPFNQFTSEAREKLPKCSQTHRRNYHQRDIMKENSLNVKEWTKQVIRHSFEKE